MSQRDPVIPITPQRARALKKVYLPEQVLEVWNAMIVKNLTGNTAMIRQDEIVAALCNTMNAPRQQVFDDGWLEIEAVFGESGWTVVYDKPGYNETYRAKFTFTEKRT